MKIFWASLKLYTISMRLRCRWEFQQRGFCLALSCLANQNQLPSRITDSFFHCYFCNNFITSINISIIFMTAITDNCFREKITDFKKILSLLGIVLFHQGCIVFLNTTNSPLKLFQTFHDVLFSWEKFLLTIN